MTTPLSVRPKKPAALIERSYVPAADPRNREQSFSGGLGGIRRRGAVRLEQVDGRARYGGAARIA